MSEEEKKGIADLMKDIDQAETHVPQLSKEEEQKLIAQMDTVAELITNLKAEYNNEIPFSVLKEKTSLSFEAIRAILLQLIMDKKLIAFINDNATEDLADDILMIREKRIVDTLEPEYRTG